MNELISVIMSTCQEPEDWLRQAIESILNQTYKNIEFIIVIDNPSNEILGTVIGEYARKDNRIKVLKNDKNRGLVYSLNRALCEAKGKYIARMDADDISTDDRIEKQMKFLEEYQYDLIGAQTVTIDENGNELSQIAAKVLVMPENISQSLKYSDPIAHPTWFGKKSLFETLKAYRNIPACEDYDFLLRAAENKAVLGNIPIPLLKYRYNFSGISRTNKAKQRCAAYYLSEHRNNIGNISELRILEYLDSERGQKQQIRLERYYERSKTVLEYKISGQYAKYIINAIWLVLFEKNGRRTLKIILRNWLLYMRDQRKAVSRANYL